MISMSMVCSLSGSIVASVDASSNQALLSPSVVTDAFRFMFPMLAIVSWLYTDCPLPADRLLFFNLAKKHPSHASSTLMSNDADLVMPSATAVVCAV